MAAVQTPVRRSALYRRHLALGAQMAEEHGWQVAAQFSTPEEEARRIWEGAGLADDSWLGKLDVRGEGLEGLAGTWKSDDTRLWRLARGHALVTCEPHRTAAVLEGAKRALNQRPPEPEATTDAVVRPPCVHVTDVTSAYSALLLAGPASRDVLAKLTALDVSERALPPATCVQTGLAHVHAIVQREDLGEVPAYRLLVDRAYGEYVWDAALHAGHELGIAPFGLRARRLVERG